MSELNTTAADPDMMADWAASVAEVEAAGTAVSDDTEEVIEETADEGEETSAETEESAEETLDEDSEETADEDVEEDEEASEETPEKLTAKELDQLKKLAEKHGFVINDKGISKRDIAAFTDKKRRLVSQFNAEKQKLHSEVIAYRDQVEQEAGPYKQFLAGLQGKDPDALAQTAGYKDWNELQGDYLKNLTDPGHQKMKELQKRLDDEQAEKKRLQAQAEQENLERTKRQALINYKLNLSKTASESKDPLAKVMFDDRLFIDTVFSVQKDSVDPLTGKTITLEEALDTPLPNGKTLRQNLEHHYKKLAGVFGGSTKAPDVQQNTAGQKASAPKKAAVVVPKKKKSTRELSDNELVQLYARKMKAAAGDSRR
jgi:hypothetical protein